MPVNERELVAGPLPLQQGGSGPGPLVMALAAADRGVFLHRPLVIAPAEPEDGRGRVVIYALPGVRPLAPISLDPACREALAPAEWEAALAAVKVAKRRRAFLARHDASGPAG